MPWFHDRTCLTCGKVFSAWRAWAVTTPPIYCSSKCTRGRREPLHRQFWRHVLIGDGCWIWTGKDVNQWGHGRFAYIDDEGNHHRVGAHRFAYEFCVGPIPEGKHLDHFVCDTPACVRFDHLRPATQQENVLRSKTAPAAINARKTHCSKGHPFNEENTLIIHRRGKTSRMCRECGRKSAREYARRKHGYKTKRVI